MAKLAPGKLVRNSGMTQSALLPYPASGQIATFKEVNAVPGLSTLLREIIHEPGSSAEH
jgi:hypothetical protein